MGNMSRVRRRQFLIGTGALFATPLARAQTSKTYRVGLCFVVSEVVAKPLEQAFLSGLRDHGYVLGRNLVLDVRYGDGDPARLPTQVDELIALKPDVLAGFEAPARVMKAKTSAIPIVLTNSSDPVGIGLAQSLRRPGGNVTGISIVSEQMLLKNIGLMREVLPHFARFGLLLDTSFPSSKALEETARSAAGSYGAAVIPYYVSNQAELEKALAVMAKDRLDVLLAGGGGVLVNFAGAIAEHSLRQRLPLVGNAELGGLLSYGPNLVQAYRDSARYVAEILKGAKPADLPIAQPTRFQFVVNLKTAKTLGIKVPQTVLLRADRVIE
jgi:ABC-type uncharacterized transport system substrate-binding protein